MPSLNTPPEETGRLSQFATRPAAFAVGMTARLPVFLISEPPVRSIFHYGLRTCSPSFHGYIDGLQKRPFPAVPAIKLQSL